MHLLAHFHELSLPPKNAQALKGLILQLAVQGKLTAKWRVENPDVEPASVLLERIQAEKAKLVVEKKIRKEKVLPPIEESESLKIPRNWINIRLGEIGDWGAGATPLRSNPEYYGGKINWYKSGELNNGLMDYESEEKITELAISNSSVRLNKPGDVLIAMYGATIGKTGLLKYYGTTNQAVCACTCFDGVNNLFLHLLLKAFKRNFTNQGEGGAQPNISRVKIRNTIIGLPPLAEQKAIVQVVDQLFQEVEQLEQLTEQRVQLKHDYVTSAMHQLASGDTAREWASVQPHFHTFFDEGPTIKQLRETILQLAVQGKLTAKWRQAHPDVEPASALLERIQAEKAQLIAEKKIRKEKALAPIGDEDLPYTLPEGWVWCRLGELTKVITKGSSPKWQGVSYVEEGNGILFITSENVGNYNLLLTKKKYVEKKFNEIEPRSILQKNDILMNIVGGSIGRTAIYNIDTVANINQAVTIIRLIKKVDYQYFLHFFNSPICIGYMYDKQVDNARPNLSMGNITKFKIPLPPLPEQQAIVAEVNRLMALCDALEAAAATRQAQVEQLMQSVLREVFEGAA